MILKKECYTRSTVSADKERLYVFQDCGERSSGTKIATSDSEYSKRFNKKVIKYPVATSSKIRGLDNAYPLTTLRKNIGKQLWNDSDFDEFKKVIDEDFEYIKRACVEKGYKEIVFPSDGILDCSYSKIKIDRCPKLFSYIIKKEIELKNFEP